MHDQPSTAAGPCDVILDTCGCRRPDRGVDYFFFLRFVVFRAVFFAAAFVFLFFAIAALLA